MWHGSDWADRGNRSADKKIYRAPRRYFDGGYRLICASIHEQETCRRHDALVLRQTAPRVYEKKGRSIRLAEVMGKPPAPGKESVAVITGMDSRRAQAGIRMKSASPSKSSGPRPADLRD